MKKNLDKTPDANRDPISGEPGAHPLGVAGGGTGGAVAGAAIGGAVGGPIGAAVGGAIGAVAGGYAGKGAAEAVNPTEEDEYWRTQHTSRPYYRKDMQYDTHYRPAYQYGWESASNPKYTGNDWNEVEPNLERDWTSYRGASQTQWTDVRDATRDSWERVRTRAKTSSNTSGVSEQPGSGLGDRR